MFAAFKNFFTSGWAIIDNFNRADNSVLGTSSSGAAWTLVSGAFAIASNKASTVALQNDSVAVVATGRTAAYKLRAELTSNPTTLRTNVGLIGHYVNSSNFILVVFYHTVSGGGSTGGFSIFKKVAGTFTALYDSGASSYTMGISTVHTLDIDFRGTSVAVTIDGVLKRTQTLTAPEQAIFGAAFGTAGLRAFSSAAEDKGGTLFDNLSTLSI